MPLLIRFTGNELHDYLRVDHDTDAGLIDSYKTSAMAEAEGFLNTDFSKMVLQPDGTLLKVPMPAPDTVKLWVMDRVAAKYEGRGKAPRPDFSDLQMLRKLPFRG